MREQLYYKVNTGSKTEYVPCEQVEANERLRKLITASSAKYRKLSDWSYEVDRQTRDKYWNS